MDPGPLRRLRVTGTAAMTWPARTASSVHPESGALQGPSSHEEPQGGWIRKMDTPGSRSDTLTVNSC